MINQKGILVTCDDAVQEFAPLKIILFSSCAYGKITKASDIDYWQSWLFRNHRLVAKRRDLTMHPPLLPHEPSCPFRRRSCLPGGAYPSMSVN